jgi:hypothetical protein
MKRTSGLRGRVVLATCLLFCVSAGSAFAAAGVAAPAQPPDNPSASQWSASGPGGGEFRLDQVPERVIVKMNDHQAVEKLSGEAARSHLRNLLSRHPEAFTEAQRVARERGWKDADVVHVERTLAMTTGSWLKPGDVITAAPASFTEYNSDGEITFWSADAGTDSVWAGTIYVEVYSTGAASTWDGELDVSTTDYPWIWYQQTWERTPIDRQMKYEGPPPRPGQFLYAVLSDAPGGAGRYQTTAGCSGCGFARWAACWRIAVVTGCGSAAVACLRVGPLWPACWAYSCLGAEVGSAMGCYFYARG